MYFLLSLIELSKRGLCLRFLSGLPVLICFSELAMAAMASAPRTSGYVYFIGLASQLSGGKGKGGGGGGGGGG